jgi:lipoprotein signal peptidase
MPVLTPSDSSARPEAPGTPERPAPRPRGDADVRARLLVAAIVTAGLLVDQATKAIAPGGHVINPGGTAYLLPDRVRSLWEGPHVGALLDLLAVAPLVVMVALALRARSAPARVGWSLLATGWGSNWADRIGLSALTQPGSPRGAVDWLHVPGVSGVYNLADMLVVGGTLVLLVAALSRQLRLNRSVVAGTVALCLLALWVGVWSGDRRAEQAQATAAALHGPEASYADERTVLQRRIDAAEAVTQQAERSAAQAALAARKAGVRKAEMLLAPGQQFACIEPKAGRCVVTETVGSDVRLVYPLRRPAWAVAVGLPPGSCEIAVDPRRCVEPPVVQLPAGVGP